MRDVSKDTSRRSGLTCSRQSFTRQDGFLHPGDQPGLGVELDADEAGKYPYIRAYLPYDLLADGTVHDW